ncbi:tetratricopeptide repeat protein [Necator americanus]|uniref:procollagen-proline 4-dioxygenase n=1 Tax=Necator americanus TaxID=51031 RepID=W2SRY2_NECAM|nr:tetratricopeptide repeat protein [Necator americanus]ETN72504.1 tetratricopeptide repeat protein [Necator americanus]
MWSLGLLLLLFGSCTADIFSAIADMQMMLGVEKEVTAVIDNYIAAEQKRLDNLKRFADEYIVRNKNAADIGPDFVTNPINAYLLIKRLTSEWKKVEDIMRNNVAEAFIKNITENRSRSQVRFPEEEDLSGAATAILRLQDVYKLDTNDLSNGIILGEKVSQKLTAHDAFEVGRAAYNQKDYYHTLTWMQTALNKLENEEEKTISEAEILEYLAYSLYQQGNLRRALALTKRLAAIAPNHPRAQGNVKWYEDMLEGKDMEGDLPPIVNKRVEFDGTIERDAYEALCRGETPPLDPSEEKLLYCYLKLSTSVSYSLSLNFIDIPYSLFQMDKPFLRLAPIKVEILRLDPLAVLFKEVLSDEEMEVIKKMATPKLKRATVQNAVTGELETASYRISKSAWLKEEEHPVIGRVNRRIEDMTNLNQKTSEDLQVIISVVMRSYNDLFKEEKNAFKSLNTGNRLATVLFYMTQPERGGATVFNHLGTAVFPTKHDALFWYNLMRSGEGDLRTRHAACPVLLGVKWVSNKWIHERGQEFTRPCGLDEDVQEYFVGDLTPRTHGVRHKYNVSNL